MRNLAKYGGWMVFVCFCSIEVWASEASSEKKEKITFDGHGSVGFELEEFRRGESKYEGKLRLKTKRDEEGYRGVLSVVADSPDARAIFEDIYIDKLNDDQSVISFGQSKKNLGLDFEYDRFTVRKNPLYRKLETFAYVGRDLNLTFQSHKDAPTLGYESYLRIGYAESLDASVIYFGHYSFGSAEIQLGEWFLLQADRIDGGRQMVFTSISSIWQDVPAYRYALELCYGKDPFESEFEKTFGNGRSVFFYGVKSEWIPRFLLDTKDISPVTQLSLIGHDAKTPQYNTWQGLLGVKFQLSKKVALQVNSEWVATNSKANLKKRSYSESGFHVETRLDF